MDKHGVSFSRSITWRNELRKLIICFVHVENDPRLWWWNQADDQLSQLGKTLRKYLNKRDHCLFSIKLRESGCDNFENCLAFEIPKGKR
jgi:hypothetical protein